MKSWLGMLPFLPSMQMIVQRYEDRGIHVDYEPLREGIGFVLRVVSMPFRGEQSLHSIIEVSRAIHELNAAIFDGDLKEREFQIARERANARARHDFVEHSLLSYALSTFSGRGDPLTDLSTEQIDLNATTLEDVRNFRKLFKREKSVKGVLQGAWPDAEVASLSGALSGLVNVSHLLPAPDLGSRGVAQRPEISDQVSSRVLIRRIGLPYLPHSKEHWYAKILAQILYQRMRWILRGESGLAYHYHASVEVSEEKQIYLQLGVESPGKLSSLASGLTAVVEQLASTDPTQEEIAFAKKRVLREFYSVTQSLEGQFWAAFEGFSYQTVRMDLELLSPREFLIFLRRALPPLDSGSLDGDQGRRSLSLLIEENPSHDAVCQVYLENQHQK